MHCNTGGCDMHILTKLYRKNMQVNIDAPTTTLSLGQQQSEPDEKHFKYNDVIFMQNMVICYFLPHKQQNCFVANY